MDTRDPKQRDLFIRGYLDCAVWCGLPEENQGDGYGIDDFSPEAVTKAREECEDFLNAVQRDCPTALREWTPQGAGHDFWLTRNHHGAGFWDRYGYDDEAQKQLTALAHTYGSADCYINDEGSIDFA